MFPPRKLERYFTGDVAKNDLVFSVLFETLRPRSIFVLKEIIEEVSAGFPTLNWVLRS